jgi:cytochrome b
MAEAAGGRHDRQVLVRDLPVRIFHWTLVPTVAVLAFTGFLGEENWLPVHVWAGQVLAVLVIFRLIWWFAGGRYSRLSAYPLSPSAVLAHLRAVAARRAPLRAGHNPAGAWNIVIMITLLLLLTITGYVAWGGQELAGPLASLTDYESGEWAAEIHEFLAWLLLLAIAGHLAGIFLEVRVLGHPLLSAMTRGRMPVPPQEAEKGLFLGRGLLVLALAVAVVVLLNAALAETPATRWRAVEYLPAYVGNCADCHHAHHPSLRTAADWERIIAGLADHFGEDATVGARTEAEILAFLKANDATRFDTEAAVRMGRVHTGDLRITSGEYWQKRHAAILDAVFRSPAVGSKANCNACHCDAETGRFDDAMIRIPPRALRNMEGENDTSRGES